MSEPDDEAYELGDPKRSDAGPPWKSSITFSAARRDWRWLWLRKRQIRVDVTDFRVSAKEEEE